MADDAVHVDPNGLRAFAHQLSTTIEFYKNALERLDSRMSHLSQSWKDEQFNEFRAEVTNTRRILQEFISEATTARRNILADADRAESAQRINLR